MKELGAVRRLKEFSSNTQYKIGFKNSVQCALFHNELQGQISDGLWENASPKNHWMMPSEAETFVTSDANRLGPNFIPFRPYNFASKELVLSIGSRMLFIAKAASAFPKLVDKIRVLEDAAPYVYSGYMSGAESPDLSQVTVKPTSKIKTKSNYDKQCVMNASKLLKAGTLDKLAAAYQKILGNSFGKDDLLRELKDMSSIYNAKVNRG